MFKLLACKGWQQEGTATAAVELRGKAEGSVTDLPQLWRRQEALKRQSPRENEANLPGLGEQMVTETVGAGTGGGKASEDTRGGSNSLCLRPRGTMRKVLCKSFGDVTELRVDLTCNSSVT